MVNVASKTPLPTASPLIGETRRVLLTAQIFLRFQKVASPPIASAASHGLQLTRRVVGRQGGLILLSMSLWLAVIVSSPPSYAQPSSRPASTLIAQQPTQSAVTAVESVGMTVSDMDRAVDFYSQVLSFKKISDVEVLGSEYEQLQGLFGVRMRVVRMQLGGESMLSTFLQARAIRNGSSQQSNSF
jgi:hypothetical protein